MLSTCEVLVPEEIVAHKERKIRVKVMCRYLVKFHNNSHMDAKWIKEGNLVDSPKILSLYLEVFGLEPILDEAPTGAAKLEDESRTPRVA